MSRPWLLALWLMGCQGQVLGQGDELGPYFVLSGPVSPEIQAGPNATAAIAWVWSVDGALGASLQEVPFEPGVNRYSLSVLRPPSPSEAERVAPAPQGLGGVALLWGLPVLVEPELGKLTLSPDPELLLGWFSGSEGSLGQTFVGGKGRVVAVATDYALMSMNADSGAGRLASAPEWDVGSGLCRFDGVVFGLTVYRQRSLACWGWHPLANPGERTEFQGVLMEPVP